MFQLGKSPRMGRAGSAEGICRRFLRGFWQGCSRVWMPGIIRKFDLGGKESLNPPNSAPGYFSLEMALLQANLGRDKPNLGTYRGFVTLPPARRYSQFSPGFGIRAGRDRWRLRGRCHHRCSDARGRFGTATRGHLERRDKRTGRRRRRGRGKEPPSSPGILGMGRANPKG